MNSKLREQGKREEKRRLKEFVENAYRCDPRVIAHKEAQRAERWAACAPLLASIMQASGFGFVTLKRCIQCINMQFRKRMCCIDELKTRFCVLRRERKRTEKHLERQRKQEAEEAAAAEAAAKKAEEDEKAAEVAAEARKQRQAEKKLTQKERARLRSLIAGRGGLPSLALCCPLKHCLSAPAVAATCLSSAWLASGSQDNLRCCLRAEHDC